jgi:hypothetical protein
LFRYYIDLAISESLSRHTPCKKSRKQTLFSALIAGEAA